MGKGILFFMLAWFIVMASISVWNTMAGNEKFTALKAIVYSFVTAVVAMFGVVLFVSVF